MDVNNINLVGCFVLFGFILLCLIFLCTINVIAKRYLKGVTKQTNEEEELLPPGEETEDEMYLKLKKHSVQLEKLPQKPAAFQVLTKNDIISTIRSEGFKYSFAAEAIAVVSLKYVAEQKVLLGNVETISGLNILEASSPQEISFHVKIIPQNIFSRKTKWKSVKKEAVLLSFSMGPLDNLCSSSSLFFRLYGRKTVLSRPKCYGQFYIELDKFMKKASKVIFKKQFSPKGNWIDNAETHKIGQTSASINDVSTDSKKC
ncbi:uncharacterized protein LOC105843634 isoform X2 [Hydra vulgaris]|uniref:Uncharacterized protein LOC105843634 isoform X2 n=1 Tax=Hydra vulgaris TaxID=6087 RepID=A0ABM4CHM1_HYDVU